MDLIEMYPAAVNSKVTVTLGVLNADSTIIEVLDGSVLPDAPNLLVLGSDQTAETVKLTAKEGNTLTVERGIQGNAIAWPAGTQIARNFTAKDWNDLVANVATIVAKIMGLNAEDVHARPDTWMPSASDVGAFSFNGNISSGSMNDYFDDGVYHITSGSHVANITELPNDYPSAASFVLVMNNIQFVGTYKSKTSVKDGSHIYVRGKYKDGSAVYYTAWKRLTFAEDVLPLDGGDNNPLLGWLLVNNGFARFLGGNQRLQLDTLNVNGDYNNRRVFTMYNSAGKANIAEALLLSEMKDGKNVGVYYIYGEHNKELLTESVKSLPLADGFTEAYSCYYHKNADGDVVVRFHVDASEQKTANTQHTIATLPTGYRPGTFVVGSVIVGGYSSPDVGALLINTNGSLIISSKTPWKFTGGTIVFKPSTN